MRYVLVHNFLRKPRIGSKKWRWPIQWMIQSLRHLQEEFECQILKYSMRGLLQHWTESYTILTSKEESVWRNKKLKKRTVSFAEDRSLTWSTSTSGSLEPTNLSRTMPTYSLSVYEMMMFRISIRNGMKFYCQWRRIPPDDILEGLYKLRKRESEKLKTVLELYDLEIHQKKAGPDYHRLKTMVKRSIGQDVRNRNLGARNGNYERTPCSRIREQNSVYKEFLEIVGNGKPTGNVWKETIAVSATIWISVGKVHHQIRLRILSCSRVSENHRGPEVPEARVPVEECFDCPARFTSKERAPIHFVKNDTLQNACSTGPRVVADVRKSALMHIARLTNSLAKGPKRMVTKVQWLCWRRVTGKKENLLPMNVTIDRGNLGRRVIKNWDKFHLNVNHLMHGNWVRSHRSKAICSLSSIL